MREFVRYARCTWNGRELLVELCYDMSGTADCPACGLHVGCPDTSLHHKAVSLNTVDEFGNPTMLRALRDRYDEKMRAIFASLDADALESRAPCAGEAGR